MGQVCTAFLDCCVVAWVDLVHDLDPNVRTSIPEEKDIDVVSTQNSKGRTPVKI